MPEPSELEENTYNRYQTQVLREDSLISARMDWMCSFQGFLMASLALSFDKPKNISGIDNLIIAISWLGLISSLAALITIFLGIYSFNRLHKEWQKKFSPTSPSPSPSPFGLVSDSFSRALNYSGLSFILPLLTSGFWIYTFFCLKP